MAKTAGERTTPWRFFKHLDARYHFDLDLCATRRNAQVEAYFGRGSFLAEDAFEEGLCWAEYGETAFLNPPYSEIPRWLGRAAGEVRAHRNFRIVALLPSNTSARWWHHWVWDQERGYWRPQVRRVVFWDKRLTFLPHTQNAMWPSVVVEFAPEWMIAKHVTVHEDDIPF